MRFQDLDKFVVLTKRISESGFSFPHNVFYLDDEISRVERTSGADATIAQINMLSSIGRIGPESPFMYARVGAEGATRGLDRAFAPTTDAKARVRPNFSDFSFVLPEREAARSFQVDLRKILRFRGGRNLNFTPHRLHQIPRACME